MTYFANLLQQIQNKTARLVVIGVGYVGLPVAARFAEAGFQVTGLDVNKSKVAEINQGLCPIEGEEPGLADLIATQVQAGRLKASTDYATCQQAQIILIAVETPIDSIRQPRYAALRAVLRTLSTPIYAPVPGRSSNRPSPRVRLSGWFCLFCEPMADVSLDAIFHLVHCPERVMPGRLLQNLREMSRVVGGNTPEAAQLGHALYQHIVQADLDMADCVTGRTSQNRPQTLIAMYKLPLPTNWPSFVNR